jgi:hypothetical protein
MSALSYQSIHDPNSPAIPDPIPSIDTLVASVNTTISLQGTLPLDPPNMSVNNTSTNTPTSRFKGIAPNVFTSDHSRLDAFLNKFRRYKMLNHNNKAMNVDTLNLLQVVQEAESA